MIFLFKNIGFWSFILFVLLQCRWVVQLAVENHWYWKPFKNGASRFENLISKTFCLFSVALKMIWLFLCLSLFVCLLFIASRWLCFLLCFVCYNCLQTPLIIYCQSGYLLFIASRLSFFAVCCLFVCHCCHQMIHLELLARHKGSVLGNYPGEVRPMLLLRILLDPGLIIVYPCQSLTWLTCLCSSFNCYFHPSQLITISSRCNPARSCLSLSFSIFSSLRWTPPRSSGSSTSHSRLATSPYQRWNLWWWLCYLVWLFLFAESFQQDGWVRPSPHWGNPRWSGGLHPAGQLCHSLEIRGQNSARLNQDLRPPTWKPLLSGLLLHLRRSWGIEGNFAKTWPTGWQKDGDYLFPVFSS